MTAKPSKLRQEIEAIRALCIEDSFSDEPPPLTYNDAEDLKSSQMLAAHVENLEEELEKATRMGEDTSEVLRRLENAYRTWTHFLQQVPAESKLYEQIYGGPEAEDK